MPRRFWQLDEPVDEAWATRRDLAAAVRELSERVIRTQADPAALERAQQLIEQAISELPQGPTAHEAFVDGSYFADPRRFIDRTALVGQCNPIAPPLRIDWRNGAAVCDVTLDERFVGAPGMAHGGVIAAIYDQLCGFAVIMNGLSGFTVDLSVKYRIKTPLHVPLHFSARLVEHTGRRMQLAGSCELDGTRLTECEALFLRMEPSSAQAVIRGT